MLMSQLGVILLAFSDTLMVGHYGVAELASAAFVNSLFLVPNVMLLGLTGGITPLVGSLYAKGDNYNVGSMTRAAMQVNLRTLIIFMAVEIGVYFLLPYFGQDPDLLPLIRNYYLVLLLVPLPMVVFNVIMQTSNGVTDTRMPMLMTIGAVVFNIVFNYLLIFGKFGFPELGLTGAGIATVMARFASMAGIWIVFRTGKNFKAYQEGFRNARKLAAQRRRVWATSWPLMMQSGFECGLWSLGAVVVGWFGAVQLAAYQVVNTISQLGFMIYMSFASAVAIRVANYAGVKDEVGAGRAARASMHINLVLATAASLVFLFAGRWLITLFVNTDAGAADGIAVVASAMGLLAPLVVYQYMDAVQLTMCNAIRGTSQVRPLLWISLISYIIIGVPVLLLFADWLQGGNVGAYWSFTVALAAASVIATIVFKKIRLK